MGVGGQRHILTSLPPGKTRYSLYNRLGGHQGRPGREWKFSLPTGNRSPDRPESLYRLSYPYLHCYYVFYKNISFTIKHLSNMCYHFGNLQVVSLESLMSLAPYKMAFMPSYYD